MMSWDSYASFFIDHEKAEAHNKKDKRYEIYPILGGWNHWE